MIAVLLCVAGAVLTVALLRRPRRGPADRQRRLYPFWVLGDDVTLRHDAVTNLSAELTPEDAPPLDAILSTSAGHRRTLDADPAWKRTVSGKHVAVYERP